MTIKSLENKKHKFLFFISYSGLENDIEVGINKENIKNNFINLNKYDLPIVHYWRPFLPQNSDKEKILEVYNFVKHYAKCSVAIGLKIKESYKNSIKFWSALEEIKDTTCAESIWTQTAYKYIWGKESVIDQEYPIFKTTSCATIHGICLNTKEFSLLSLLTKYKIKANKSNSDYYWNSFINDAKQIII